MNWLLMRMIMVQLLLLVGVIVWIRLCNTGCVMSNCGNGCCRRCTVSLCSGHYHSLYGLIQCTSTYCRIKCICMWGWWENINYHYEYQWMYRHLVHYESLLGLIYYDEYLIECCLIWKPSYRYHYRNKIMSCQ